MPKTIKKQAKKQNTKKSRVAQSRHELLGETVSEYVQPSMSSQDVKSPSPMRWGMLIVGLLFIAGIYAASKGYIVAAVVNGSPVFRWDVTRMLTARYGQQTLESIISEKLIADTAKKEGVTITQKDIDAKTSEVVKSLGPNVKLDDLLKYQGMNKSDFEHQIAIQLTVERILGKGVTVSDAELDEFISVNKDSMLATDEAALKGEAREALMSQKINEKIQPWFAKLKESAKIVKLMK